MRFQSRIDAADELARELAGWRQHKPVVLGVPPGGVAMATRLAAAVNGQVDLVYVHRLVSSDYPDVTVGSVDITGRMEVNDYASMLGITPLDLAKEATFWRRSLQRLRQLAHVEPIDLHGRAVIIVDDGATSGSTLLGAVHSAHEGGARVVAVAVPVLPVALIEQLEKSAAVVVTLAQDASSNPVPSYYQRFESITDADVIAELREARLAQLAQARIDDLAQEDWSD
jgi:predicted phosphoribosyltransferase